MTAHPRSIVAPQSDAANVVAAARERLAAAQDPAIFLHVAEGGGPGSAAGGPLQDMPFAVKDNIDVEGMPTTAGCPAYGYAAQEDAVVVARLRAAGAVPVGKTNLDQFATGLVGTRSPYGVPRNALQEGLVPGGSSSGSAVAVARGIVPFALGTDTAGSGRVPAALNGVVGLKPSLGLISARGVVPACRTLDTVSVFARSVAEAYRVLEVAAGHDPADAFSRPLPLRPAFAPETVRLGIPDAQSRVFFHGALEEAFDAAMASAAGAGIELVPLDFAPFYAAAALLYDGPWVAERHAVVADLMERSPDTVMEVIHEVIGKALGQTATDAFRGRYRLAELRREVDAVMAGLDGLLVPSVPSLPTMEAVAADPIGENSRLGTYTNFVNLLDMCAATVPTAVGAPHSVTVIARAGQDHLAAGVADRIHRFYDPDVIALSHVEEPVDGEMALAVVGAHMGGLPLNGELTSRGGRFLRAGHTAPHYKLFALPGGPPFRPGLVRVESGGAEIAIEVWALPASQIGSFMAGVPAPLSIGTLTLSDGSSVKGFLCEGAALSDAQDVTRFGGWRTYLAAG